LRRPPEGGRYLPHFLDAEGKDIFDQMKPHLGWIGYGEVEDALKLRLDNSGTALAYQAALKTMVDSSLPTDSDYRHAKGLCNLPLHLQVLAKELSNRFACAKDCHVISLRGSYSVIKAGSQDQRVVAKIIPSGARIFVGVRENTDVDMGSQFIRKRINGVIFLGVEVAGAGERTKAEELIDRFNASQTA
jgi:hypothetical protein